MQQFTGLEYLYIDIANQAGLDKLLWEERIDWVKTNMDQLESLVPEGKTKPLYIKAVKALRDTQAEIATGFIMALDATASGIQCMSALGKCRKSALACNLVNTGNREDIYSAIMSKIKGVNITREEVKESIIPMSYGSSKAPKDLFGEGTPELKEFLYAVEQTIPILGELKALTKAVWNPEAEYHRWTLPDGHVIRMPTLVKKSFRVEICGTSYTYQYKDIGISENSTPLLANVIHSVDSYVAREMIRKCDFQLLHIHDNFYTSANNMQKVRETFRDIMVEIAKSNLLEDILSQIAGEEIKLEFSDPDLWKEVQDAEYMLS